VLDDAYNFLRERSIAVNHCIVQTSSLLKEQMYSSTAIDESALTIDTFNEINDETYVNELHIKRSSNEINDEIYINEAHINERHIDRTSYKLENEVQINEININKSLEKINDEVNVNKAHINRQIVTQD